MKSDSIILLAAAAGFAYLLSKPKPAPQPQNAVGSLLNSLGLAAVPPGGGTAPAFVSSTAGKGSSVGISGSSLGLNLDGNKIAKGAGDLLKSIFGSSSDKSHTKGPLEAAAAPAPPSQATPEFVPSATDQATTVDTPANTQDIFSNFDSFGNDVSNSFA